VKTTSIERLNMKLKLAFFSLLFLLFIAGCSAGEKVDNIVFSGRVSNTESSEWLNERLVIIFLKDKEVGRSVTAIGEFPGDETYAAWNKPTGSDGITDGIFIITVPNTYGLTQKIMNKENSGVDFKYADKFYGWRLWVEYNLISGWVGEIPEGNSLILPVAPKNISYTVKVINGEYANLPPEIKEIGSTLLKDDGTIVVVSKNIPSNGTLTANNITIEGINYATTSEIVELNKFTVPIDNCAGSVRVSQKYTQSQTFIHEYHEETSAGVSLELPIFFVKIVPELQTRYGYQNGQIETKTVEYDMAAEPYTKVTYIVTWQEVWENGVAKVNSNGTPIEVNFKAKTNLIYKIDSEPASCQ
jgi:hypothetical protein